MSDVSMNGGYTINFPLLTPSREGDTLQHNNMQKKMKGLKRGENREEKRNGGENHNKNGQSTTKR